MNTLCKYISCSKEALSEWMHEAREYRDVVFSKLLWCAVIKAYHTDENRTLWWEQEMEMLWNEMLNVISRWWHSIVTPKMEKHEFYVPHAFFTHLNISMCCRCNVSLYEISTHTHTQSFSRNNCLMMRRAFVYAFASHRHRVLFFMPKSSAHKWQQ